MEDLNGPVWVIGEQVDGQVVTVTLQLIGQARKLADQIGTTVEVVLLGDNIEEQARDLFSFGADRVYLGNAPVLSQYQSEIYTDIIVKLAREKKPDIMLLGSTHMGRELAPLTAARLQTGLTAHCIDLVLDGENILEQKIPAYGGLITIICPEKRPQMATVAKGVFPLPEAETGRTGELITLELAADLSTRVRTLETVRTKPDGVPLETAKIVIAGGAGVGDTDGWAEIEELAGELNAAIGSTRPAMDIGWAESESMIGQSGKMISPDLYIGIGLSGELQHMVGISGCRIMVAINNDPKSPVFEQVDFGVVDDCRQFIPLLTEKIRQHWNK
jgi:electron transfer flavoprotein alpha subunit